MQVCKRLACRDTPALDPEGVISALARQRGQLRLQGVEPGALRRVQQRRVQRLPYPVKLH